MPGTDDVRDRLDIVDVCLAMHWHLDRQDWPAFDDVFDDVVEWPVAREVLAEDDAVRAAGHGRAPRSRAQVVESLRVLVDGIITQHLVAGHRVLELGADRAVCLAHSINT